jgi:hypothetical protein
MMFMVFLARTEPAQSMANPSCIAKTRYAEKSRYVESTADVVSANWLHRYSVAFAAGPSSGARVVAHVAISTGFAPFPFLLLPCSVH